jgi:hypothetical protein
MNRTNDCHLDQSLASHARRSGNASAFTAEIALKTCAEAVEACGLEVVEFVCFNEAADAK